MSERITTTTQVSSPEDAMRFKLSESVVQDELRTTPYVHFAFRVRTCQHLSDSVKQKGLARWNESGLPSTKT